MSFPPSLRSRSSRQPNEASFSQGRWRWGYLHGGCADAMARDMIAPRAGM